MAIENLITEHIDIWTSAIQNKSSSGRGSSKKIDLYGIKKLRELILELAVRGKLVPQDPNDGPASVLLDRIEAEKAQLVKEKKIKKPKSLLKIADEEKPFDLPIGWVWVRLNDIGEWGSGSTPKRSHSEYYGGNIPWFKSGELNHDYIEVSEETITEKALLETSVRHNNVGDVLVAMYGATIGKTSILSVRATTNQAVCACTTFTGFNNVYLLTLLKASRPRLIGMGAGGAQPNISREKIINTVIGLPPTSEQHRIVAKVDELMTLCDQLEQQTEASIEAHQVLVEALLATLTNSADADELMENWQRISTHFDTLFTTEASIDQLKQTILQLAVMGKLVPQDPNDEPASVLLDRIAEEKAQLVKDGKIKRQKALPPIADDEKPFELPNGWEWCRFSEAIDVRDGTHDSPKDAEGEDTFPLVTSKNFVNGDIDFENARRISAQDHFEIVKRSDVSKYDILFSMIGGNIGNQVMVKYDRQFSIKNVALFKYYDKELTSPDFVFLFTQNLANTLQDSASGGAQPFVSLGVLRNLLFPIPPVEEQKRIVAKIAVLIEICEQLQASIKDAQTTQLHLTDAIIEQVI
jgi:type I restriction enzyme, S subunit